MWIKWHLPGFWQDMGWKGQQGTVLLEAAVSIPLLALLVMTAVTIFFWAVRIYFVQLADVEMEQEVQIAFQRLMDEAMRSERIDRLADGQGYTFVKKHDPLKVPRTDTPTFPASYWVHEMQGLGKLVCGDNDAPMTGDHAFAAVTITAFRIVPDLESPGVYHLRLTGRSLVTQHEYSLSSAVYLPGTTAETKE